MQQRKRRQVGLVQQHEWSGRGIADGPQIAFDSARVQAVTSGMGLGVLRCERADHDREVHVGANLLGLRSAAGQPTPEQATSLECVNDATERVAPLTPHVEFLGHPKPNIDRASPSARAPGGPRVAPRPAPKAPEIESEKTH